MSEQQGGMIVPPTVVDDIELTAMVPAEMRQSQMALIGWCEKKIRATAEEIEDTWLATEKAATENWKTSTLKNQHRMAVKRKEYYVKIKAALEAGFYIIPNFPIDMFAIKTKAALPSKMVSSSYWSRREQDAQELPMGVGDYKNPIPIVEHVEQTKLNDKGQSVTERTYAFASDWDEMEFPINMAKVDIMDATAAAMRLNIFDRIGVMPTKRKADDPVIIGQIIRKNGYLHKVVSFMIAWHLNTNVL